MKLRVQRRAAISLSLSLYIKHIHIHTHGIVVGICILHSYIHDPEEECDIYLRHGSFLTTERTMHASVCEIIVQHWYFAASRRAAWGAGLGSPAHSGRSGDAPNLVGEGVGGNTANLRTKSLDFRGFDSSIILMLKGGIPRPIGNFPES